MQICFVCEGNTCRSPFAEKLFKSMLKKNNIRGISVTSCGINVSREQRTSPQILILLEKYGIKFNGKKAQKLTKSKLEQTDLFITMTKYQKQFINSSKVYSLGELAGGDDVLDPYQKDMSCYEYMAQQVSEYLNVLIKKLKGVNR